MSGFFVNSINVFTKKNIKSNVFFNVCLQLIWTVTARNKMWFNT